MPDGKTGLRTCSSGARIGRRRTVRPPGSDSQSCPGARHAAGADHSCDRVPLPRRGTLSDRAEYLDRRAAGGDQHRARRRHDLRHPHRRHRPVGRQRSRRLCYGGADRVADTGLGHAGHPSCLAHRPAVWPDQRQSHRLRQAATLHRHARVADRGARAGTPDGQRFDHIQSGPAVCLHRQRGHTGRSRLRHSRGSPSSRSW